MRRLASSWDVIEGVLKENAHSAYKALKPPASETSIARLETLVSLKLPAISLPRFAFIMECATRNAS